MPSPLQKVECEFAGSQFTPSGPVEVWCKRDDLLHSQISGNKWRKLIQVLSNFMRNKPKHVISFGGPYSNHLHALGFCCRKLGIPFTAIIRGEYLQQQALNASLQDLSDWGASLVFVNKQTYRKRDDKEYLASLRQRFNADVIIPEGGSQQEALIGMQGMLEEVKTQADGNVFDAIVLPVGSGASMAGIVNNCRLDVANSIIGVAALKGEGYLEGLVQKFLPTSPAHNPPEPTPPTTPIHGNKDTPILPWHINHDFHFGGYAKSSTALSNFVTRFNAAQKKIHEARPTDINKDTPILIEPVYSGKCFYALNALIEQGYFKPHSKILVIHTGGLQGARRS